MASYSPELQKVQNDVRGIISRSAFNRQGYTVNIPMNSCIDSMLMYTGYLGKPHEREYDDESGLPVNVSQPEYILKRAALFQRDNDKWTEAMQVSFIENVIKGVKSKIQLYQISEDALTQCWILDGLQRTTALLQFYTGKIKPFGYTFKQLCDAGVVKGFRGGILELEVFTFDTHDEAIDFYIEMNENISHSQEDIERARSFYGVLDNV